MRSILEEETAQKLDLQHINAKLLLDGNDLDPGVLDAVIPTFHSWIQDRAFPELLIDVTDYRHVHHGPGIVLIGHEADYSIDNADGHIGLRYNRKAVVTGTNDEKLARAFKAALSAAKQLQEDTRLNKKLNFNGHDIEIFVNDRIIAPNGDATRQAFDPVLRRVLTQLFAGAEYSVRYESDLRRLFGATIHSERVFPVDELIQNLNS